jgi:hypothetical protein
LRQRAEPTGIKFEDEVRGGAMMKWIERWRPEMKVAKIQVILGQLARTA